MNKWEQIEKEFADDPEFDEDSCERCNKPMGDYMPRGGYGYVCNSCELSLSQGNDW